MVCSISCTISAIFIIGMIYFYNATRRNKTGDVYKQQLNEQQRAAYDNIVNERLGISIQGYLLGALLSLAIIVYNYQKKSFRPITSVCIVLATCFLTNYFYYMLSPKSDWMLTHVENKEQTQAWLEMYRSMQYQYHFGLALGIVGMGFFAYAFKCGK